MILDELVQLCHLVRYTALSYHGLFVLPFVDSTKYDSQCERPLAEYITKPNPGDIFFIRIASGGKPAIST